MTKAHAGERVSEFEALLGPALSRAYAVALHLTGQPADAEDLVQEAALLAFRGFDGFTRGTNFGAWFTRILINAFLSGRRRRRPEDQAVPLDDVPNAWFQRQAHELVSRDAAPRGPTAPDVALAVAAKLETEQIGAAISSLPEEFRVVSALYFLQDLSYREIADTLGIPVGTVRSRLHRGRALLQRRLWQLARDHGIVDAALAGAGGAP
jgi:RNA polymerase sigma-70 factor (ECF subfamily)